MLPFTSMLYLTSMLPLGFYASLTLHLTPMLSLTSMLYLTSMLRHGFNTSLYSNALSRFRPFPSLRRRGHIECDHVFFLVTLNLTAMLSFTSMLHLTSMLRHGFNTSLYSNALSRFQPFPSLRRRGHIECDHVFFLNHPHSHFNAFLHFNAASHFNASSWFQNFPLLALLSQVISNTIINVLLCR